MSTLPSKTAQNIWETTAGQDFLQLVAPNQNNPAAWVSSDGKLGGALNGQITGFSNIVQLNSVNLIPDDTSLVSSFTNSVTAGNLIFVFAANDFPTGISDSQGNSYTQLASIVGGYSILYYAVAKASNTLTVTITYGSSQAYRGVILAEYTNPFPLSPIDVVTSVDLSARATNFSLSFLTNHINEKVVMFANIYGLGFKYVANNPVNYRLNTNVGGSGSTFVLIDHPVFYPTTVTESGFFQFNVFDVGVVIISIRSK